MQNQLHNHSHIQSNSNQLSTNINTSDNHNQQKQLLKDSHSHINHIHKQQNAFIKSQSNQQLQSNHHPNSINNNNQVIKSSKSQQQTIYKKNSQQNSFFTPQQSQSNNKQQQKKQDHNDQIQPGKRPRQQSKEQQKVSLKKRHQFCDGSIIFNIDPQYELQKLIGSGIYGIVASGKNKLTNQPVAIKKISKLFNNFGDTRRVLRQVKVLEFLNHKNIIALQGIMSIQNPQTFNQIYLIMEYMEFDLRRLIQSQMKITQQMIKFIMYQLLVAINFMHSADILHRDLKPQNILMNKKCELKIADMNLARKQTYTGNITDYVASRPYRAPQILIGSTVYTKSVDIWSIGCIFAQLLGKTIIFHGKDYIDQLKRFVAILGKPKVQYFPNIDKTSMESLTKLIAQIPDKQKVQWKYLMPNISDKAADLLDHMLTYDAKARYTAQQCLNHPYLQEYKKAPRVKCKQIFDFSFDRIQLKQETLRTAIYNSVLQFNAKKNKIEQKQLNLSELDKTHKKVKQQ